MKPRKCLQHFLNNDFNPFTENSMLHTLSILTLFFLAQVGFAQQSFVKYSGKMSKIGQEGRTDAAILVDTINAKHLYAIGPVENLRGEIIVWDSRSFVAAITTEKKPFLLRDVKDLKAIFLVYADVAEWDTIVLTQKISSMRDLEAAVTNAAHQHGTDTATAFPFLLFGKVKEGSGHIMFKDSSVTTINPETLKQAKQINTFSNQKAQMLGFYSQHHQTIFTHHDSYLHIHYRLWNRYQAGHLEVISFDEAEPVKLLLPHK